MSLHTEEKLMRTRLMLSILVMGLLTGTVMAGVEINTTLMNDTYRIEGPSGKPNEVTYGTGFIMGIPYPSRPGKGLFVLITAAHVLEKISGEKAKIYLRRKISKGKFVKVPRELRIRKGNKPLWVRHPIADVAVMKVALPLFVSKQTEKIPMLSINLLADDKTMEKFEIHPGDRLFCLGYPLGVEANQSGFPILRSGTIASYPLTPAKDIKSFLFDFEVFNGNSGGPVYFVEEGRSYGGNINIGEKIQFVVGIITEQKYGVRSSTKLERSRESFRLEIIKKRERLKLAIVVPAYFIKETLNLLNQK